MKRLAACLVAFAAAGFATDGRAGGTSAAAQGTPDDAATSDRDGFAAAADEWGTDLAKALETAGKEKKVVLAAFVSSDGDKSGWCKKLKAEIFDTKEFQEWAKKGVVLLEVDFSREKKQSDDVKKQNKELQEKHRKSIEGYPTVLFLDAKGELVGKLLYQEGGPAKWTKEADKILAKAKR